MHFAVGVVARARARVRRVAHAFLVCHHGRETSDRGCGVRCVLISGFNVHADAAWTSSLLCVFLRREFDKTVRKNDKRVPLLFRVCLREHADKM